MAHEVTPRNCALFSSLTDEEYKEALRMLDARLITCKKGDFVWGVQQKVVCFAYVLEGSVHVCSDGENGEHTLMATVGAGGTFGESLCYLGREADVYPLAAENARVMLMRADVLRSPADPLAQKLAQNFTAMLAERTLTMNTRIQILSRLTIRDKIEALFLSLGAKRGGPRFTLPFDRAGMAFYLGTDRAALSRELSKMKKEGVIDYQKNQFLWH